MLHKLRSNYIDWYAHPHTRSSTYHLIIIVNKSIENGIPLFSKNTSNSKRARRKRVSLDHVNIILRFHAWPLKQTILRVQEKKRT